MKYKNNCCNIIFLSSEISFSFITFMTILKFSNKYYRYIRIKMKYNRFNNLKRNNYLSHKTLIQNGRNNSLFNSIN